MRLFPYPLAACTLLPKAHDRPRTQRRLSRSQFLLVFWLCYICCLAIIWYTSRDNPTSWFFEEGIGYRSQYSNFRHQQANSYIHRLESTDSKLSFAFEKTPGQESICIGVPTVARHGARYFRTTIGSLLEGLSLIERSRVFLIPLIAHSDPNAHPAFSEEWLAKVSDRILTYSDNATIAHMAELEGEFEGYRQKALLDYAYIMQACVETGLPYIGIVEDDVIALDGWYHRTMKALATIEDSSSPHENAYLRMFYTEQLLGWNSEEWSSYLTASVLTATMLFFILAIFRYSFLCLGPLLGNDIIAISCIICLPLVILLYFASGRVSIHPGASTVVRMDNYGCCAQGLVFSREMAQNLIPYYRRQKIGFADMLTEQYAVAHNLNRWAISPSVLQHIGHTSSKEEGEDKEKTIDTEKKTIAEEIRSFSFERNDPELLKGEHEEAIRQQYAWEAML